ncbi:hypothetical protein ACRS6B_14240 [Nocardia asteroides]
MVQPTPWSAERPRSERVDGAVARLTGLRARPSWGYLGASAGGIVTLVLLFQPWLTAVGADGRASADAFGRMTATTSFLNVWSSSPPPTARISGALAILSVAAIIVTVCAAAAHFRFRNEALARLATISSVTAAALVVLTVLYLNSKSPELRAMLGRTSDLGGQVGMVTSWAFGNGSLVVPGVRQVSYNTAGLTSWALLSGVVSLGSAVAALAQWIHDRRAASLRPQGHVAVDSELSGERLRQSD